MEKKPFKQRLKKAVSILRQEGLPVFFREVRNFCYFHLQAIRDRLVNRPISPKVRPWSLLRRDVKVLKQASHPCLSEDFDRSGHPRIAVQIHLFYLELTDEIIDYVNHIPYAFDCFVSTDSEEKKDAILSAMERKCRCRSVRVEVFPNRGRDVAPFLMQMAPVLDQYDYVCHIHSKRTVRTEYGDDWRTFQYRHLLGGEAYLQRLFYLFEQDPRLGLIFPVSYPPLRRILRWESNREGVSQLLSQVGYKGELPRRFTFPAGNMLWVRTQAVKSLFALGLRETDFPEEAGQVDQTLAHCVERAWVYVAQAAGYGYCRVFCKEDQP